jgi:hypothetical protein
MLQELLNSEHDSGGAVASMLQEMLQDMRRDVHVAGDAAWWACCLSCFMVSLIQNMMLGEHDSGGAGLCMLQDLLCVVHDSGDAECYSSFRRCCVEDVAGNAA